MLSSLPRTLLAGLLSAAALSACSATAPGRTAAAPSAAAGATAVEVNNTSNREADIYVRVGGAPVLLGAVGRGGRATFPLPSGQRVEAIFAKHMGNVPTSTDLTGDPLDRVTFRYVRGD